MIKSLSATWWVFLFFSLSWRNRVTVPVWESNRMAARPEDGEAEPEPSTSSDPVPPLPARRKNRLHLKLLKLAGRGWQLTILRSVNGGEKKERKTADCAASTWRETRRLIRGNRRDEGCRPTGKGRRMNGLRNPGRPGQLLMIGVLSGGSKSITRMTSRHLSRKPKRKEDAMINAGHDTRRRNW